LTLITVHLHKALYVLHLAVRYQQVFHDVLPCELEDVELANQNSKPFKPAKYEKYA